MTVEAEINNIDIEKTIDTINQFYKKNELNWKNLTQTGMQSQMGLRKHHCEQS